MLVVARKPQERIVVTIPDTKIEIEIVFLNFDRGAARIGIEAPKDFQIERRKPRNPGNAKEI